MKEALKIVADYISEKEGVSVVFSDAVETASADLKTKRITLPTFIPNEIQEEVAGLLLHEAQHLRVTQDTVVIAPVKFPILNVLEDIRINELISKRFANFPSMIDKVFKMLRKNNVAPDMSKISDSSVMLQGLINEGNGVDNPLPDDKKAIFEKDREFWDSIIKQTKTAKKTSELLPIVDEVWTKLTGIDENAIKKTKEQIDKLPKDVKEAIEKSIEKKKEQIKEAIERKVDVESDVNRGTTAEKRIAQKTLKQTEKKLDELFGKKDKTDLEKELERNGIKKEDVDKLIKEFEKEIEQEAGNEKEGEGKGRGGEQGGEGTEGEQGGEQGGQGGEGGKSGGEQGEQGGESRGERGRGGGERGAEGSGSGGEGAEGEQGGEGGGEGGEGGAVGESVQGGDEDKQGGSSGRSISDIISKNLKGKLQKAGLSEKDINKIGDIIKKEKTENYDGETPSELQNDIENLQRQATSLLGVDKAQALNDEIVKSVEDGKLTKELEEAIREMKKNRGTPQPRIDEIIANENHILEREKVSRQTGDFEKDLARTLNEISANPTNIKNFEKEIRRAVKEKDYEKRKNIINGTRTIDEIYGSHVRKASELVERYAKNESHEEQLKKAGLSDEDIQKNKDVIEKYERERIKKDLQGSIKDRNEQIKELKEKHKKLKSEANRLARERTAEKKKSGYSSEYYEKDRKYHDKRREMYEAQSELNNVSYSPEQENLNEELKRQQQKEVLTTEIDKLNEVLKSGNYGNEVVNKDTLRERIKEYFRNRPFTMLKHNDTGSIDGQKLPNYYNGDVFQDVSQEEQRVRIHFYIDISGSMSHRFSNRETKARVYFLTQIFGDILEGIEENKYAQKIDYKITLYNDNLALIKEFDDEFPIELILKSMSNTGGSTDIKNVVDDIKKIDKEKGSDKNIVIVLTDGDFHDFDYEYISKNEVEFPIVWIGIGFSSKKPQAKELFKNFMCETVYELYEALVTTLQEQIDQATD